MDDQLVRVLQARAELRLSRLGAGADEEQLPVPDVGQVQAVVDLGDAAGSRQVLAKVGPADLKVAAVFWSAAQVSSYSYFEGGVYTKQWKWRGLWLGLF